MRNAISGAWLYSIVLIFMTIFIAFISISFNYSNSFKLKTDMITKIEQYKGFNQTSIDELDFLMQKYGYLQKGSCRAPSSSTNNGIKKSTQYFGVKYGDKTPVELSLNPSNEKYSYCIYSEIQKGTSIDKDKYYYTVEVFFGFSLPVVGELFTFRVNGETNSIYFPNEKYFLYDKYM